MLVAGIHLQLPDHLSAETVLREHAPDRITDNLLRAVLHALLVRGLLEMTNVPGVAVVLLVLNLVAGYAHLVGIDNNDKIAGIGVRSKYRLMFAAKILL